MEFSDLIGIPFSPHGRDETGIDCFGLIWLIAFRKGIIIPDPWYKGFDLSLILEAEKMPVKKIKSLEPGCVIEMEKNGRLHLGYAIDTERMIHATKNEGVVIEKIGKYPIKGYYAFN